MHSSPYLECQTTDLVLVGEAGAELETKKPIQFPHDDSHYIFYVSLRSDCLGQEKWPSKERKISLLPHREFEACSRDSPTSRSPRGLDKTPQEQTSWRILKETFSVCRNTWFASGPLWGKGCLAWAQTVSPCLVPTRGRHRQKPGIKERGSPHDPSFLNPHCSFLQWHAPSSASP